MRPIEYFTMAPKSWEASNQKMNQIHKQESSQAQLATSFGKEVKQESKTTTKMTKTDQNEHRYDDNFGGSRGSYFGNGGKQKKKDDTEEKRQQPSEGSRVDIYI